MIDKIIVCVVSSEKTYFNLDKFCFNSFFAQGRNLVDVALVFNGKPNEIPNSVYIVKPNFIAVRPNLGLDPGGLNFLISFLPDYSYYLLLHDDHHFADANWVHLFYNLLYSKPEIDVWGNLFSTKLDAFISNKLFLDFLDYRAEFDSFTHFIQGYAGLYKYKVIKTLKETGNGIIYPNLNDSFLCQCLERYHSYFLYKCGFIFGQIPPGYEKYLLHK